MEITQSNSCATFNVPKRVCSIFHFRSLIFRSVRFLTHYCQDILPASNISLGIGKSTFAVLITEPTKLKQFLPVIHRPEARKRFPRMIYSFTTDPFVYECPKELLCDEKKSPLLFLKMYLNYSFVLDPQLNKSYHALFSFPHYIVVYTHVVFNFNFVSIFIRVAIYQAHISYPFESVQSYCQKQAYLYLIKPAK